MIPGLSKHAKIYFMLYSFWQNLLSNVLRSERLVLLIYVNKDQEDINREEKRVGLLLFIIWHVEKE